MLVDNVGSFVDIIDRGNGLIHARPPSVTGWVKSITFPGASAGHELLAAVGQASFFNGGLLGLSGDGS